MVANLGISLRRRLQPRSSWLRYGLLAAVIILLAYDVVQVNWIPEGSFVIYSALLGLVMASYLADRQLSGRWAWALLIGYGIVLSIIWVGQLLPRRSIFANDWPAPVEAYRQQLVLIGDRVGGWFLAVFNGDRTEETIIFAFALSLTAWFLSALAAWSTFRWRRPLPVLMILAFLLSLNTFYGRAPLWPVSIFIGLAILLVAVVNAVDLEKRWESGGVDYPDDIRVDLLMVAGGIMLVIAALSLIVPAVDFRAISQAFSRQPAVQEVEDTWNRVFAGVRQPELDMSLFMTSGPGGAGSLPRSFLLGNPPELVDAVAFRAAVETTPASTVHWRGASYDTYTGSGWSISNEREEEVGPGEEILQASEESGQLIIQAIERNQADRGFLITLGLPLQFDQEVVTLWRGVNDFSRVAGEGSSYSAVSQMIPAAPDELRQATLDTVPAAIRARYTQLPDSVSERVRQLGRDVSGISENSSTPYDQAKSIELFLRQYPYSLDVDLPPEEEDPVDYFLFDLQRGYCDYYASAMVVLARSVGLPARLGVGYLVQPEDESGYQTVTQENAHSWAEVYFAGYGWVEFEPTAAFPNDEPASGTTGDEEFNGAGFEGTTEPFPIPPGESTDRSYWWLLSLLLLVIPLAWVLRRHLRSRDRQLDRVSRAYGKLLRHGKQLGLPTPPSQTPREFQVVISKFLEDLDRRWLARKVTSTRLVPEIQLLTSAYEMHQYSGRSQANCANTRAMRHLWRSLRLLRLIDWFQRKARRVVN